jgi:hypothetical protein
MEKVNETKMEKNFTITGQRDELISVGYFGLEKNGFIGTLLVILGSIVAE